MKSAATIMLILGTLSASAGRVLSLGDFTEEVKGKVNTAIEQVLNGVKLGAGISGVVTGVGEEVFFLQAAQDGIKVVSEEGKLPEVGDLVTVEGVPSLEGGRIIFIAKHWTREGAGELPVAIVATPGALLGNDGSCVHALRVMVEGRVLGPMPNGFALEVGRVPVSVIMEKTPAFLDNCEVMHPKVKIVGVADLLLDQSALLNRHDEVIGVKLMVSRAADVELVEDMVYLLNRKDWRMRWVIVAVVGLLGAGLLALAVVIVRQRRRYFRSRTIMAERKRMADDIHDTIEQHLVGAGMLLKLNRLKEAQDVLVRAKREIRDIVWGLKNDDMMRKRPAEMIRELAHEETKKGICRVETKLAGLPEELDASAMRDLSLIIREAIGNAVKHGVAKKIAISADALERGGWRLRIANDGEQFDPSAVPGAAEGHFGLEGMRQRARRLGAEVTIEKRGRGMVVSLERKA